MKILYIGDVTSKLGRQTVAEVLPAVIREHAIDYVIAQGENVSHGKGLQTNHAQELEKMGVNFFTGGNHSLAKTDYLVKADNAIRPANLKGEVAGRGYVLTDTPFGKILVVSLQGQIVGMDADKELDNPLEVIEVILKEHEHVARVATLVNFHGDYSSEKVVIGQYLDGRVTAVIGDHWHVQTSDAEVLPGGTAHITDVGMTGALDSSLGVKTSIIIERWRNPHTRVRNEMEENGRRQFSAVVVDVDIATGLARSMQSIFQVIP